MLSAAIMSLDIDWNEGPYLTVIDGRYVLPDHGCVDQTGQK